MLKQTLSTFSPIADAITRLLHPHAEAVIHDIKSGLIRAIYNPFSKRKVGDPSLLSKEEELTIMGDSTGPYEKLNWDGRKLKSVSSLLRNEHNEVVGLLCINLDISVFAQFSQFITEFIGGTTLVAQPEPLFKDDWQERINNYVHAYLNEHSLSITSLTRHEKKELIEHLHQIGAFTGKNSAQYIAQIIKVSRATVYNYLSL